MKNLFKTALAFFVLAGSATFTPAQAATGYLVSQEFSGGYLICNYRVPGYSGLVSVKLQPGRTCPSTWNF
ncbi:hypothetical protein [Psittacicella gerlachiana]|uniref:Uncharacterized protein n=1 Tax=Psittacicella gerlachiana TaxID=2028574 RepID=A0A3A1YG82_9GAMM|nr:hypothetical protein [Psittacicella gerlachiana]RIY35224.1 hypothetical protein CKF59_03900 [Psittacicella gerlachiana]